MGTIDDILGLGYHLVDGTPTTLNHICKTEPLWAANRIRELADWASNEEDRANRLGLRVQELFADRKQLCVLLRDAVADTNANHRNRWLDDTRALIKRIK